MFREDFNQNFYGEDINVDVDLNVTNDNSFMGEQFNGMVSAPIVEPMQERVMNRTIVHEVPHVC